jgi:hypothetical protein
MTVPVADNLFAQLTPGRYGSIDVSQTKEKGVAICLLTINKHQPISIRYYHQPLLSSDTTKKEVAQMVKLWPQELLSADCYSVDSPLW